MAQSQQQQKQHSQSVFPSPPSFYSLYTDENLSLWQKLHPPPNPPSPSSRSIISSQEIEESKPQTSLNEIEVEKLTELERTIVERWRTEELNLSPPQIVDGEYHMFGNYLTTSDKTPTLEEHGCPQLYPKGDIDHRAELKKLNFSLLFTFLELIDTLIESPEHFTSYLEQLKVIFLNIHHLISAYRPYQATETLKLLLERQIKERQKMKKDVEKCVEFSFFHLSLATAMS
ncbi:mediator complex, subunit Med7 [Paraphysoderma sedebokerense]|nr:mediator complex, subunit Med7 [Paraphysoderma sedebokerense]